MSNLADIKSSVWGFSTVGFGVIAQGLAAIRQNIEIILKTTKGTDPLRPFFGSDIYTFIDKPVTIAIPSMKSAMIEAVNEWEPRIKILSISHILNFSSIDFTINYILVDRGLLDTLTVSVQSGQIVTGAKTPATLIVQGIIPTNPNSARYLLDFQINNTPVRPLMPPDGFETMDELFAFILKSWGTYGKWNLLNDRVLCYLNAENVKNVSLSISLSTAFIYSWILLPLAPGLGYHLHFNANNRDVKDLKQETNTAGAVIQAVKDEWGAYGVWDLYPVNNGYKLTLTSNTTKKAFLDVTTTGGGDFNDDFNIDFK